MAMAGVGADWHGISIASDGTAELVVHEGLFHGPPREDEPYFGPQTAAEANMGYVAELHEVDTPEVLHEQMTAGEVITLLDGFYDERQVKPLAPPTVVILKWGVEWLRKALFGDIRVEQFTTKMIQDLDVEANDPMDYVETHTYLNEHVVMTRGKQEKVERIERTKKVLKKGKRSSFAACIAHEAYNKFGARPMTEANVLVTRRWLQKLLSEPTYKDLRMVDRNIAIDRALFLSFVPTDDFRKMKIAVASRAWQKRVDPKGLLGGLFGKAFMLIRDEVPDVAMLD
jgi:hypothetical protein